VTRCLGAEAVRHDILETGRRLDQVLESAAATLATLSTSRSASDARALAAAATELVRLVAELHTLQTAALCASTGWCVSSEVSCA